MKTGCCDQAMTETSITNETLLSATAPLGEDADLAAILEAWQTATDRLQSTHAALRDEVCRLSDELENKNRELARKNRLADLGLVASHVAHEVRNSLVPMTLYLSLLRRQIADQPLNLDILDKFSSSLTALETTVSDLLHFSADRDPQRRVFPAFELIDDVCRSIQPQLDAQQIELHIAADPSAVLDADYDMLRRALVNLVLNALDVLPAGGRLNISAECQPGKATVTVADSGPGIDAEALDRVFEPFYSTKSGGTGLGLVIVSRIAEAHGGAAEAANSAGGGAAFSMQIPLRYQEAAA